MELYDSDIYKRCSKCGEKKVKKEFSKSNTWSDSRNPECRNCIRLASKLHTSGRLSIGEYNKILEYQDKTCAICQKSTEVLTRSLAVDHCHTSNKIRGLLCGKCNTGIGMFDDNIETLSRAISYLEKPINPKKFIKKKKPKREFAPVEEILKPKEYIIEEEYEDWKLRMRKAKEDFISNCLNKGIPVDYNKLGKHLNKNMKLRIWK